MTLVGIRVFIQKTGSSINGICMTRKCGNCGIPAPDNEALFCNRCGSEIVEVTEPAFPLCPSCGTIVSDELAEFCNRCGARISRTPVPRVCPGCGNPALDDASQFCTRCGTPFAQGEPVPIKARPKQQQPAREIAPSVVVKSRKTAQAPAPVPAAAPVQPAMEEPVPEWDPWSDDVPDELPVVLQPARAQKKYAHLPLVADELAGPGERAEPQIAVPSKKYAHLPMIAEELRYKSERAPDRDGVDFGAPPSKSRKPPQKKGMMGLFKK